MLRSMIFQIVSIWKPMRNSTTMFPYAFNWVFEDLTSFILDPFCYQIFLNYLTEKEPNQIKSQDEVIYIMIKDEKDNYLLERPSTINQTIYLHTNHKRTPNITTSNPFDLGLNVNSNMELTLCRQLQKNNMKSLEFSYDNFKKTKSYIKLKQKIQEFEKINLEAYI